MRDLRTEEEIIAGWKGGVEEPVVSICCITYNHERYIEDTIEGFLIQETEFPFEILIYDDASTDKATDIIREYQARYPILIKPIYQTENQYSKGVRVGPTFNFSRAKGEYIALCEGDDYWVDPHKLQKQKDFLDSNPDYVLCYTDCQPISDSVCIDHDFGGARRDLDIGELKNGPSIFTLTAFFKNVLGEWPAELFNAKYGDIAIWAQLGDYGAGKYLDDIKPSHYRVHSGGVHSMASKKNQLQMRIQTFMSLYSYRISRGDFETANKHLEEVFVLTVKLLGYSGLKFLSARIFRAIKNRIFR